MRIAIVALVGLGLTGCVQTYQQPPGVKLSQIQEECSYASRPLVESWNCVRVGTNSIPVEADIIGVYVATGDFVVEQVRAGKMTDAEAKLAMAEARQRAYDTAAERDRRDNATASASRPPPAVNSPMLFPPAPMPDYSTPTTGWGSPPQIIYTPRGGVMCQRLSATSVMCN